MIYKVLDTRPRGSRNGMNPSVGRILRNDGFSVTFTLGLVQGGELLASIAAATVKGAHNVVLQTDKRSAASRRRTALDRRGQRLDLSASRTSFD